VKKNEKCQDPSGWIFFDSHCIISTNLQIRL